MQTEQQRTYSMNDRHNRILKMKLCAYVTNMLSRSIYDYFYKTCPNNFHDNGDMEKQFYNYLKYTRFITFSDLNYNKNIKI